MTEPFWGGHPFLQRHGVATLAERFFARNDDIDFVTLSHHDAPADDVRIYGQREPDFTKPADWPANKAWLPSISRRRSGRPFDEMEGAGEIGAAIRRLAADFPHIAGTRPWPPECWFGRNWTSIKLPFAEGTIAIYAEGRKKTVGDAPYWTARTSIVFDRHDAPLIDVAADGGTAQHLFLRFLRQPEARFLRPGVRPIEREMFVERMIDLPLDAFPGNESP